MLDANRMSRYYSARASKIDKRYKRATFILVAIPVLALALPNFEFAYPNWLIPIALILAGIGEVAVLHFGMGGDTKAAKIMANQTTELAHQWRWLWVNQQEVDVAPWIEMLERQTAASTTESIHPDKSVSEECAREANHELTFQFGG